MKNLSDSLLMERSQLRFLWLAPGTLNGQQADLIENHYAVTPDLLLPLPPLYLISNVEADSRLWTEQAFGLEDDDVDEAAAAPIIGPGWDAAAPPQPSSGGGGGGRRAGGGPGAGRWWRGQKTARQVRSYSCCHNGFEQLGP